MPITLEHRLHSNNNIIESSLLRKKYREVALPGAQDFRKARETPNDNIAPRPAAAVVVTHVVDQPP